MRGLTFFTKTIMKAIMVKIVWSRRRRKPLSLRIATYPLRTPIPIAAMKTKNNSLEKNI